MRTTMKHLGIGVITVFAAFSAHAHPGSGIVVDDKGIVHFVHAQVGVWNVDPQGTVRRHEGANPYHWMIIDPKAAFASQRWPSFPDGEIRVVGADPALMLASSFPVTIGRDGALYYPEPKSDGRVHILRLIPGGEPTDFTTLPPAMEIAPDGNRIVARWIHGLATGPDGSFYYAEKHAVRRIALDGAVTTVAENITVPDCVHPPVVEDDRGGPILRGLDVAADGTVYVAASGCSALLKISPKGEVSVALRATDAWSPTGVDVVGEDVYVLENLHIKAEQARDWLPRVRKLSPDGKVTTLATITRDQLPQ